MVPSANARMGHRLQRGWSRQHFSFGSFLPFCRFLPTATG